MANSVSDIMLQKEVEQEVRLSPMTIYRMQKAGLFPQYFKLSPKKNAAHLQAAFPPARKQKISSPS